MTSLQTLLAWLVIGCIAICNAAEPEAIPSSARRETVVTVGPGARFAVAPKSQLPEGYTLSVAAAPPLVTHPIMGCLDDRGRLFLGDAVGVNWNKAQLEGNPPNRVLLLEDVNHDGIYDKSTIFADHLTFPQGAQWLNGSLYVGSPPGIWKLTDTDGDGIADQRNMIVSGFDYTGNAADIHGPFLHPDGRLYWCHGRKGYRVLDAAGNVIYQGPSSGIWSAKPDGSDVHWHALLAGDNPVEIDFTPEGEIVGVQNLYYSQPRGDTLVHWLSGGVYERADLAKVIEGLPRTLDIMPIVYNFGHVAVSGCCFWKSYAGGSGLQFMVTHFNTQRLVRMELTNDGSSFRARENEFLKLDDADAHFTDVMEDADGSLLVLNTGGWFRIGCPSSLMAKPDVLGSVYRIRPPKGGDQKPLENWRAAYRPIAIGDAVPSLSASDQHVRRRTLEAIAEHGWRSEAIQARLLAMMGETLDAPLEHSLLFAAQQTGLVSSAEILRQAASPVALRRLLVAASTGDSAIRREAAEIALGQLDTSDSDLARVALRTVVSDPEATAKAALVLEAWLKQADLIAGQLATIQAYCGALPESEAVAKLITRMLGHSEFLVRQGALEFLAARPSGKEREEWIPALIAGLDESGGPSPLLLDALKKGRAPALDGRLQAIANDAARPAALRLKALNAVSTRKFTPEVFALLLSTVGQDASPAARIQAATMLGDGGLTEDQLTSLAPLFGTAGPIELKELQRLIRGMKNPVIVRSVAEALAKNPALASQQESVYRTLFSGQPPELFGTVVLPALRQAETALDAKKRMLAPLAEKAAAFGNPAAGRAALAAGKGTCVACHRIGDLGRPIGPDLSKIGEIRTERDLVESILFPNNTLARDYEAHVIETSDGQTVAGVIRGHTAEGLLVVDAAGQERNVPHPQIVSNTVLPVSLMPMGLDASLNEQELLDVVAYLHSLR